MAQIRRSLRPVPGGSVAAQMAGTQGRRAHPQFPPASTSSPSKRRHATHKGRKDPLRFIFLAPLALVIVGPAASARPGSPSPDRRPSYAGLSYDRLVAAALPFPRSPGGTEAAARRAQEVGPASFCERYLSAAPDIDCQEHTVTTSDGYIVGMQRLRSATSGSQLGSGGPPPSPLPPVLLDHAYVLGGDIWFGLVNFSDPTPDPLLRQRLPVLLADAGYDVWLAQHRGSEYGSQHTRWATTDWQYWDWDWDQLVQLDLPAMLARIQQVTRQPKVHFVGYNQGGMLPLALAASRPSFARARLASISSIGPLAYLYNVRSPSVRAWANELLGVMWSYYDDHVYESHLNWTTPETGVAVVRRLTGLNLFTLLTPSGDLQDIITNTTGPICCMDGLEKPPSPQAGWIATPYRNLIHYQQAVLSETSWQKWDGRTQYNQRVYRQATPPAYDPAAIPSSIPVLVISGSEDWFADQPNIRRLVTALGNHVQATEVPVYSHMDLVFATNAAEQVFAPVLKFIKSTQ